MILTVEPDRFSVKASQLTADGGSQLRGIHVRRPVRGIVLKDDTFATLRVVSTIDSSPIYLVDGGSNRKLANNGNDFLEINGQRYTDVYSNFLIQAVNEERMEKSQILETFGEPFIFLFGERARVLNITGVLVNSFDFNWRAEWLENYEHYLRGTKCVENDSRVFLSFDETLVGGYILSSSVQESSTDRNFVQFNFQLFVTNYSSYSKVGSPFADPGGAQNARTATIDTSLGRPNLDLPNDLTAARFNANGQIQPDDFFSGLQNLANTVRSAWSSVQNLARGVTSTISGAMNGEIIRIPRGFEGTMAFDTDATALQVQNQEEAEQLGSGIQSIKYTVFSDNLDEYVGASDHYGSSILANGQANRVQFETEDTISRDSKLVAKARQVWTDAGFNVNDTGMSPAAAFLLRKGVGMGITGLTSAWKTGNLASGLNSGLSVGLNGLSITGGIALAGRLPEAIRDLAPGQE